MKMDKKILDSSLEYMRVSELLDFWGWGQKLPFLSFPVDWEVKIIPPFNGALARFLVRKKGTDKIVSVYFDAYNRLGVYSGPYWEVYPVNGYEERCSYDNPERLLELIEKGLNTENGTN